MRKDNFKKYIWTDVMAKNIQKRHNEDLHDLHEKPKIHTCIRCKHLE